MFADAPPIMDDQPAEVMLADLNEMRASRNLPPVRLRMDLECAAQGWAKVQWRTRQCGHDDPRTRQTFPDRVAQCGGYLNGGYEAIACNMGSFKQSLGSWLRDPRLRYALFDANITEVGLGHAGFDQGAFGHWYVIIIESPQRGY